MNLDKTSQNQIGDTIVEVLIAVAVVGSVLTGAFAVSNLSLRQIRQAQERTEAQKVATSSIEKLDKFVFIKQNILNDPPVVFCIKDDYTQGTGNDAFCDKGTNNRYHTSIVKKVSTHIFIVTVTWESLNGTIENVTMSYRIREPI